ncbi:hypothetical protein KAR91_62760, partial [Candidatus Pacearchaeota archaeon]|nr:hypothetical protein [Candidatus Pacearchaeota archaeon]
FSRIRRTASTSVPSIMGVAPMKDGTLSLLYQPTLVDGTTDETLKLVLEHEGMHVLNKHIPRLLRLISNEVTDEEKFKKSRVFNIAADCAVNPVINMPREVIIGGKPFSGCFPDLYDLPDMKTTEYYFENLMKQNDQSQCGTCSNGDGKGEESKGDGDGKGEKGCEGCSAGMGGEFDKIGDHSKWGNVKDIADVSAMSRKIDNYVQEIIRDSLKSFERKRGSLPGYIEELITEALTPPQVPYYQIIRKLVKGSKYSKFKRAFTKINRKRTYVFAIDGDENIPAISPFPGRTRDFTFKIVIVIDTSGSMSTKDVMEGLSGVKSIIEKDRHTETHVILVDTQIADEYRVKKVHDINFNIKGRGGTRIFPGLERAKEYNPDIVLCFTDGYCDNINEIPRKQLPKKIIYVVQENGNVDTLNETGYIVRVN